jgi:hypothetical protein
MGRPDLQYAGVNLQGNLVTSLRSPSQGARRQREHDARVTRRPQGAISERREWSAVINCGFSGSLPCLDFPMSCLHWELAHMRRNWTPSIVPNGPDQAFYIVVNNYGELGPAFAETGVAEADIEMTGIQRPGAPRGVQHLRTLVRGCIGGRRAGDYAPP